MLGQVNQLSINDQFSRQPIPRYSYHPQGRSTQYQGADVRRDTIRLKVTLGPWQKGNGVEQRHGKQQRQQPWGRRTPEAREAWLFAGTGSCQPNRMSSKHAGNPGLSVPVMKRSVGPQTSEGLRHPFIITIYMSGSTTLYSRGRGRRHPSIAWTISTDQEDKRERERKQTDIQKATLQDR